MLESLRLKISPDVLSRRLGDETVLLHVGTGTYFGLDAVGSRVWSQLEAGSPLHLLVESLVQEYEVTADQLERDVTELCQRLMSAKLVLAQE